MNNNNIFNKLKNLSESSIIISILLNKKIKLQSKEYKKYEKEFRLNAILYFFSFFILMLFPLIIFNNSLEFSFEISLNAYIIFLGNILTFSICFIYFTYKFKKNTTLIVNFEDLFSHKRQNKFLYKKDFLIKYKDMNYYREDIIQHYKVTKIELDYFDIVLSEVLENMQQHAYSKGQYLIDYWILADYIEHKKFDIYIADNGFGILHHLKNLNDEQSKAIGIDGLKDEEILCQIFERGKISGTGQLHRGRGLKRIYDNCPANCTTEIKTKNHIITLKRDKKPVIIHTNEVFDGTLIKIQFDLQETKNEHTNN